mgnify:FL=1
MKPGFSISETQQLLEQLGAGSETLACLKKLQSLTSTSVRILSAPPGVAGFVMPGQSRAMFINLYTALFATPEFVQRVVRHEDMHLRHQEMMNMEIPFFHELQDIHVQNFTKALRENPFDDLIGLIEGFTE